MAEAIPVFDGHNDFLLRLLSAPARRAETWLQDTGRGHLDLPRMRRGGFAGGLFAVYIASPTPPDAEDFEALMNDPPYDLPLPAPIALRRAQPVALAMAGHLAWMERASDGAFRLCRSAAELRAALAEGVVSGVMHFEGAEAIGADLDALYLYHAMGLRSLGPVWSRPTVFGHGVPFRFPATPDTGPGLTPAGKDLVRLCNELRIMIDLSHMNENGFDDVAALSDAPLVATHSNAHAVTPHARNLTDRQLDVIAERGGMVGLNYATVFLRPDGRQCADMGWEPMLRHLDHLIAHLGEDHVGLGSDFDGALVPRVIGDVTGLPAFQQAMRAHGYDDGLIAKLCHRNWLDVLERIWGG
ncbi:peptidase M19 [Defluviimonas sp. 20V17]|uniref:Dipeptidase AC. Metallo peptidase. MEROPS family M19 n=1 Tax=Allgaiera indica TaxID=765699 RepID=A0AAN4UPK2_9RHOB|nr:dipeptidase [Allgaiera indica]KDB03381.1 peptidase M19 [Defluviimonas sp. 20V17]GHE00241.1 peptidase M19 [Allgaiera indica]SDW65083.1 dipeptidase AC. Metallo peptidase. MEROPS family M19 [Allgaiera indica]